MKTISTASLLAVAAAWPALAFDTPLVTAADLNAGLDQEALQIIDIRAPDGEDGFATGHIAGALNAPYGVFRGPAENPGQVPDVDALERVVGDLGLDPNDPLVITYQGSSVTDFGAAARVYWTFKSLGFDEISILNGGLVAWTEADLALTTEAATPVAAPVSLSWDSTWTATVEDVQAAVDGEAETRLIDARPESFWNGDQWHSAAARPGTLPQSEYFVHASWFNDGPTIIDAEAAATLARDAGLEGPVISFCNTGHWAATNWFAMSELAGLEASLYPESMVGWSNAGHEMANVPGRLRMLWLQVRDVF